MKVHVFRIDLLVEGLDAEMLGGWEDLERGETPFFDRCARKAVE